MQYNYTNEGDVPVKMTLTHRELVLLEKLLSKQEGDWRYDDMHTAITEIVKQVTESLSNHYQYEQYKLERKEEDDA